MIAREIVKKINEIGENYLTENPKSYFNLGYLFGKHTNHPIALKMKNFSSDSDQPQDYERFLMSCYYRLPKFEGKMALAIQAIMMQEFQKTITSELLIKSITPQDLQALGADYDNLPSKTFGDNKSIQYTAKKLMACDTHKHNQSMPEYQKVWLTLAEIYSESSMQPSKLKDDMLRLFSRAFNIYIQTTTSCHGQVVDLYPSEIAAHIYAMLNTKFSEFNKGDRELEEVRPASASSSSRP
ncbi:MAG: hypothetical protein P4M12_02270 [Gammaproteobacteria bacterium]|nr:hypothetical protein [Gammaproteobacteria bacterium]